MPKHGLSCQRTKAKQNKALKCLQLGITCFHGNICAWVPVHTDTVIMMQFLYSSGPRALCATPNRPWWLSSGPSTGGGKQETNAVFKDRKHVQMVRFSHCLFQNSHMYIVFLLCFNYTGINSLRINLQCLCDCSQQGCSSSSFLKINVITSIYL